MAHVVSDLVAPLDALLLKGDADPSTRAIMIAVLILGSAPGEQELSDAFERASRTVPRMRQRVVGREARWSRARWEQDPQFDLADHLRRTGPPGDATTESVIDLAAMYATTPIDPARPLWDATLVTGLSSGGAALILRMHHAIADGVRAVEMLATLLDVQAHPTRAEMPPVREPEPWFQIARVRMMRTASEAMVANRQRARTSVRAASRAARRPLDAVTQTAAYANSAIRTYGHDGAQPSALMQDRSRARRFRTLEFPLADLRRVSKAHDCTINDVYLAGLLGGLRAYHEELGVPVADIPIALPINLATADAPLAGNHFSAVVIPGPCSVAEPAARLRAVHELVASRREEPAVDAPARLAPILQHVPGWLSSPAISAYARRVDLQASNIIGPPIPLFLAGSVVDRIFAFGPLPGVPMMAVLTSYRDVCTIGLTIDPAAVTDVELFISSARTAFAELMAPV